MSERIDGVELDDQTAGYVHRCAQRAGIDTAAAIAAQLRQLADAELADASHRLTTWHGRHPEYLDDAEAETLAALTT
jgi:hypothetical protein